MYAYFAFYYSKNTRTISTSFCVIWSRANWISLGVEHRSSSQWVCLASTCLLEVSLPLREWLLLCHAGATVAGPTLRQMVSASGCSVLNRAQVKYQMREREKSKKKRPLGGAKQLRIPLHSQTIIKANELAGKGGGHRNPPTLQTATICASKCLCFVSVSWGTYASILHFCSKNAGTMHTPLGPLVRLNLKMDFTMSWPWVYSPFGSPSVSPTTSASPFCKLTFRTKMECSGAQTF